MLATPSLFLSVWIVFGFSWSISGRSHNAATVDHQFGKPSASGKPAPRDSDHRTGIDEDGDASAKEVRSFVNRLSDAFTRLARDEMGALTMQAAFDRLQYDPRPENADDMALASLVDQLSLRLRHYGHLVSNQKNLVLEVYREQKGSAHVPRQDCCSLSERDPIFESVYGVRVSRRRCCDLLPADLTQPVFNPGHNLTQRFLRQLDYWPNVKWIYFITAQGLHTEFPAHNFRSTFALSMLDSLDEVIYGRRSLAGDADHLDASARGSHRRRRRRSLANGRGGRRASGVFDALPALFNSGGVYDCLSVHQLRHRDIFVRSVVPEPIWLVIVLDQSEASRTQLFLSQRIARLLLASLSEKDRVGLVLASGDSVRIPQPSDSHRTGATSGARKSSRHRIDLFPAVQETKLLLGEYINTRRLPGTAKTNHTRALVEAFTVVRNAVDAQIEQRQSAIGLGPPTRNLLIAYISRGQLDNLQEQNSTLREVTLQQALLDNRVIINAYMPVEEKSATVLFEKMFMQHLATRWNAHSDPEVYRPSDVRSGHFFVINRTTDLASTVGRFYELFAPPSAPLTAAPGDGATAVQGSKDAASFDDRDVLVEVEDEPGRQSLEPPVLSHDAFFADVRVERARGPDFLPSPSALAQPIFEDGSTHRSSPSPDIFYSLPYPDLEGRGLVMSISQAFYDNDVFLGVMGVDVHMADLLDQVVHFGSGGAGLSHGSSSAFIVHAPNGYTVSHPALNDLLVSPSLSAAVPPLAFGAASDPAAAAASSSTLGKGAGRGETVTNLWLLAQSLVDSTQSALAPEPVLHADISQFERVPGFETGVRPRLLREDNGTVILTVQADPTQASALESTGLWVSAAANESVNATDSTRILLNVVYRWKRIRDPETSFVVVLRTVEAPSTPQRQLAELVPNFDSCYHRLDLFKRDYACLYLRQLATFSCSTIYLPPRTFMRPFEHLASPEGETSDQVRHMVAYLVDHTALISNPGVAPSTPSTRTAVAVVERISKFWRQRTQASKYNHYIIRRYVAMDTGVMLMYPGALLPQNYDPTTRSWYLRALQFAGRLAFTGPYLDDGGAGSIVTLSYAIFEGNSTGVHTPGLARVSAVVAMDVTHRFISLLLAEWLPECGPTLTGRATNMAPPQYSGPKAFGLPISVFSSLKNTSYEAIAQMLRTNHLVVGSREALMESMKCLLLDDRGYLHAHPGFSEARVGAPLESSHISHMEPLIAADLLNHADFVRKVGCLSYTQRSLQRYYAFNASYVGTVSNFAPGEQCTRYQMAVVPGTNIFLGVVRSPQRQDCSPRAAFCSCSTKNRRCLNCVHMELMECECPCECPLRMGHDDLFRFYQQQLPTATPKTIRSETSASIDPRSLPADLDGYPVCMQPPMHMSLLPVPRAVASASLKAVAGMPDAPPLCQHSGSLSFRAPVASLHDWLLLANATVLPQSDQLATAMFAAEGDGDPSYSLPLIPAWGPVGCNAETQMECAATVGCEWCSLGPDGQPMGHSFCAPMGVCFGGTVGSPSPYHNALASYSALGGPPLPTTLETLTSGQVRPKWLPRTHLPQPYGVPTSSADARPILNNYNHYYYYYYHYGDFHQRFHGPSLPAAAMAKTGPDGDAIEELMGPVGAIGAGLSPYHRGDGVGGGLGWPNSPVGPVAGAVMAVFIVVVLGVYCLSHHASGRMRQANTALNGEAVLLADSANPSDPTLYGGDVGGGNVHSGNKLRGDKADEFTRSGGHCGGGGDGNGTAGAVAILVESPDCPDDCQERRELCRGVAPKDVQGSPTVSSSSGDGGGGRLRAGPTLRKLRCTRIGPSSALGPLRSNVDDTGSAALETEGDETEETQITGETEHCGDQKPLRGLAKVGHRRMAKLTTLDLAHCSAAIVIEGVGVFRRTAVDVKTFLSNSADSGSVPISEFESDPTAVSPYRVTSSYMTSLQTTPLHHADAGSTAATAGAESILWHAEPADSDKIDQMTTASADNGYVSTVDGQASSCADRDVFNLTPDLTEDDLSALCRADKASNLSHFGMRSPCSTTISTQGYCPRETRSAVSDPDSALGSDSATSTSVSSYIPAKHYGKVTPEGPWIGTLILGPGMEVLCDEGVASTSESPLPPPPIPHRILERRLNPSYRLLSRACKSGLTRLPVLVQRPQTATAGVGGVPRSNDATAAGPPMRARPCVSVHARTHASSAVAESLTPAGLVAQSPPPPPDNIV
nr:unnamed protein product [Spirometra erinaceieuropaei]